MVGTGFTECGPDTHPNAHAPQAVLAVTLSGPVFALALVACGRTEPVSLDPSEHDSPRADRAADCAEIEKQAGLVDRVWDGVHHDLILTTGVLAGTAPTAMRTLIPWRCSVFFNQPGAVAGGGPGGAYRTMGTTESTIPFGDPIEWLVDAGDFAFLWRRPLSDNFAYLALWSTGGSVSGSRRLRPFADTGALLHGRLLFTGDSAEERQAVFSHQDLWLSDGSPQGTRALGLLPSGMTAPRWFHTVGEQVLLVLGQSLMAWDGEAMREIAQGLGWVLETLVTDGRLVFVGARDERSLAAWCSDGTASRTYPVLDLGDMSRFGIADFGTRARYQFTEFRGAPYLLAFPDANPGFDLSTRCSPGARAALFRLDCDARTADLVTTAEPYQDCDRYGLLAKTERAIFLGDAAGILTSDGTTPGTRRLQATGLVQGPVADALHAYWVTSGGAASHLLWASEGEGTVLLLKGPTSYPLSNAEFVDGKLLLAGTDIDTGSEPWVTDGTPEGTRRLIDLRPGPESSWPHSFTPVAGRALFFIATTSEEQRSLFKMALPLAR